MKAPLNAEQVAERARVVESYLQTYVTMRSALSSASFANHKAKLSASALLPQRFQSVYAKAMALRVLDDAELRSSALAKADADMTALMIRMAEAGVEMPAVEDMIRHVNDVAESIKHSSDVSEVAVKSSDAAAQGGHARAARSGQSEPTTGRGARQTQAGWLVALEPPDPVGSIRLDPTTPTPT